MSLSKKILSLYEKLIVINKGKKNGQVLFMAGGAGCYPSGTEFMTTFGWKKIEEYKYGDSVLQYDRVSGIASFTEPVEYYNLPTTKMFTIKNSSTEFTTSIEHKHLLINDKTKNKEVMTTAQLLEKHNSLTRGNRKSLINTFDYSGSGLDLTDEQIMLKVAIYADGHFMPRVSDQVKCRMRFKKDRKIERAKQLLKANDIGFKEYSEKDFNGRDGDYTVFEFDYTDKEKEFESYWYNANTHQLEVIADEVLNWDGSVVERDGRVDVVSFSSNSKKSADFIQFALAATGVKSNIHPDTRHTNINYNVSISQRVTTSGMSKNNRGEHTTEINETEYIGRMYCFQVPSGFFVVRQNDKVFVSGNSGKGFAQDFFVDVSTYKVFDVDALKNRLIKIAKMKGDNPELEKLDLRKPEDVRFLHQYVYDRNLDDKLLTTFLGNVSKEKGLPNLLFDTTLKDASKFDAMAERLKAVGYEAKDMHVIWVLADYAVAVQQNKNRPRIVPDDILFQTHTGAAKTMSEILAGNIPKNLEGEAYVLLSEKDANTLYYDSDVNKGGNTGKVKTGISAITGKETITFKDFPYVKVKSVGQPMSNNKEIQAQIYDWVKTRVPKEVRDLFN